MGADRDKYYYPILCPNQCEMRKKLSVLVLKFDKTVISNYSDWLINLDPLPLDQNKHDRSKVSQDRANTQYPSCAMRSNTSCKIADHQTPIDLNLGRLFRQVQLPLEKLLEHTLSASLNYITVTGDNAVKVPATNLRDGR